jgi:hypothetical protein
MYIGVNLCRKEFGPNDLPLVDILLHYSKPEQLSPLIKSKY